MSSNILYLWPSLYGVIKHTNDLNKWIENHRLAADAYIKLLSGDYSLALESTPYLNSTNRLGYKLKTITNSIRFNEIPDETRNKFLLELNSHVVYKVSVERSLGVAAKKPYDMRALKEFFKSGFDWNAFKTVNRTRLTRKADLNMAVSAHAVEAIARKQRFSLSPEWANGLVHSLVAFVKKTQVKEFLDRNKIVIPNSGVYVRGAATKFLMAYDCANHLGDEEQEMLGYHIWGDCIYDHFIIPSDIPDHVLVAGLHSFASNPGRKMQLNQFKTIVPDRPKLLSHLDNYFNIRQVHE